MSRVISHKGRNVRKGFNVPRWFPEKTQRKVTNTKTRAHPLTCINPSLPIARPTARCQLFCDAASSSGDHPFRAMGWTGDRS